MVTFLDWDGTTLKTEQVEQGKSATAPINPTREGYTFTGWDKDFSNVQSDLTVTAVYDKNIVIDDRITVRLRPASVSSWTSVYLYAWSDTEGQFLGEWPGTQVSKDAEGWWSYTFDASVKNVNIIWTNGAGEQTIDITGVTQSTCYEIDKSVYPYHAFEVDCASNTALEDAETDSTPQPRKVMIDNKLYILMPDGTIYDTWGRKIN